MNGCYRLKSFYIGGGKIWNLSTQILHDIIMFKNILILVTVNAL